MMTNLSGDLRAEIERATANAINNRHRFLIMLCTAHLDSELMKLAKRIYEVYESVKRSASGSVNDEADNANNALLIVGRSKFLDIASAYFDGKFVHFADSERLLGETYASLILDLTEGFHPNDLGIVIETIAEGGMILIVAPPVDAWKHLRGKWHEELVSAPHTIEDIIPRFYRRFIKRTFAAEGTIIYDVDARKIIKKYEFERKEDSREEIKIPDNTNIKRKLYKLCATNDQVRFLQLMERFFERKKRRKYVVLTADRGRGKTAVLGIVTPFLISRMHSVLKRPVRIIVVAHSPSAVQTYFIFLRKALLRQGMRRFRSKETADGLTTVVSTRHARVEYVIPRRALVEKEFADIIIVDEASAIDVPVLKDMTRDATYAIFSSTIHGYEGAGRGFSIRFLRSTEREEDVEIEKMHMYEPIRYGCGDPIERWLYDVLLLDAKPASLDEDDFRAIAAREYTFELIDKEDMLNDERAIREFFGIYVLAHYRNRPSDVAILLDMPNHIAFRVSVRNKTICSLHVAVEGGIEDDAVIKRMIGDFKPRGQMIPDLMVKHYLLTEFPKVRGMRIVRIATHPSLMRRGIGSFAIHALLSFASNFKWVGAGFGVSPELLRFWMRNGFVPVHITPHRNEISGEYSVVVLKALDSDFEEIIERTNACFVSRLTEYLCDELRDLEVDAAILMLRSLKRDTGMRCEFGDVERARIQRYFEGMSTYEYIADIARPLVRAFYGCADKVELSDIEERVVVAKCLQLRRWWEIAPIAPSATARAASQAIAANAIAEENEILREEDENEEDEKEESGANDGTAEGNERSVYETLQRALFTIWQHRITTHHNARQQ